MYVCMYVYIVYIASSFIITHLYLEQSSINLTTELTEGIVIRNENKATKWIVKAHWLLQFQDVNLKIAKRERMV